MSAAKPRSFLSSFHICLTKYASFSGRASRSEYWNFLLAFAGLTTLACTVDIALLHRSSTDMISPMCFAVAMIFFVPGTAVCVRRLHDTNRSGWWILLLLVPVLGWLVLFEFLCKAGTPMNNVYSLPPYVQSPAYG